MVMDDDITGALSPTLDLLPMVARSPIRVDVESLKDKYCVTAEVPGLKPKDLKVNVDRGVLSIEGRYEDEHRDEDKDRSYLRIERTLGSVHRSLRLPEDVDQENIKAKYDHGVLKLTIPKRAIHLLPPGNVPIELDEHGHGRDRSADSASQKESNNQTQTKSKKTTK
jgi:HSP20 family molecular chaperone IbpA